MYIISSNRETNRDLDYSVFVITSKDRELQAQVSGCLRTLALSTADIPTGGVLVAVFFICVTVLKPSGSSSTVGPEGKISTVEIITIINIMM